MGDGSRCFDCLEREIQSDFSEKLIFCYGISDSSALPLGSRALIQVPNTIAEISPQFLLIRREDDCLTNYVDHYCFESVTEKTQVNCHGSCGSFSCIRTITALAPVAFVGEGCYTAIENLATSFLSGSVEDHVLLSLIDLVEGKPTGRDAENFLSLIGVPSVEEKVVPGCLRHPNIAPVLGLLKTDGCVNMVLPKAPYTLENILHYCPDALRNEWHINFLLYQILSALAYLHGIGIAHGDVCPKNVMLTNSCWLWLSVLDRPSMKGKPSLKHKDGLLAISPSTLGCSAEDCPCQALYADVKLSPVTDWHSDFKRWWKGELSNYDYLLVLNRLAGRRWGDHTFHTVMPWVIDFSVRPDENSDTGWRDLRKSKWRLAKGDEQLDFTYSTSEVPHHVSDECLSELAVCSYKARRLPLSVLRAAVRSVYVPNEYPSSMQRLYQWTPDESIPEFYSDPRIFTSIHSGMGDLATPSWASSPEEFVKLHRDALESSRVSDQIHHWIDITFGYMMSGQAAVVAKNVMLPSSDLSMPRSVGRRQLFTHPHPKRRAKKIESQESTFPGAAELQDFEESTLFCDGSCHLTPIYQTHQDNAGNSVIETPIDSSKSEIYKSLGSGKCTSSTIDSSKLLEFFEVDDNGSHSFQELCLWKQKSCDSGPSSVYMAGDIFSVGCILAELHLKKPLFNPTSLGAFVESGILPGLMQELPANVALVVEACIQRDWKRRPSAKSLLESPYFSATVKSSYVFLAPLHLLVSVESQLQYAAKIARQGALKAMGTLAAEMCAPYCLALLVSPLADTTAEWAYVLLKEFLKGLKPHAIKSLVLPAIQKILQAAEYSHLKVSLLQDSFMHEIWTKIGKQAYLEIIHPLVVSTLSVSSHKNSTSAASVLLMGSCEEFGVPVTVHQTILPLIHSFGKGLCADGIDVLVRIGSLLGDAFVVKHMLPLLRNIVVSCIEASNKDISEPIQSWNALAVIDSLITLDGLVSVLPREAVLKELVQVAATTLIEVCHRIGPESTILHVLPQTKELFDELAFSKESTSWSRSSDRTSKGAKSKSDSVQAKSRMDVVLLLYPSFASLLGIERLRQCCATWLLLEQILQRSHNWKWDYSAEVPKIVPKNVSYQSPVIREVSTSDYSPAKMLLNGVGWSIPQSQGGRNVKNMMFKQSYQLKQGPDTKHIVTSNSGKSEPWSWYPGPAANWDGPDLLSRIGGPKDEPPWKIRASIIHSVRAHPGALRTLAVYADECTIFTGGVGPGFRGTVQKWELQRMECVSGYYGHEEVVNDICILSSTGRVASCDGTIHIWNSQSTKLISAHAEVSSMSSHPGNPLSTSSRVNVEHTNMLNSNSLSGGILSSTFGGSLYTCMHYLEYNDMLIVGTGSGSLRFIDVARNQKLHLWKSESVEPCFSSLISAVCSCGFDNAQANSVGGYSSSWIAAGLSSGHCRLLDARSGCVFASWKAHDGYITKLAAPEDHLLVSSSLDKTLRDGQALSLQKLYSADNGMRNLSLLSSIAILPMSRLFLVGTEDGYLKICC
ncbi:hypothetical protein ACHQM5_025837 [Ranunculus cassubicifolius]